MHKNHPRGDFCFVRVPARSPQDQYSFSIFSKQSFSKIWKKLFESWARSMQMLRSAHKIRLTADIWCVYCTKLEPIFKIADTHAFPRATRLCAKHRAFQEWKVRGTHTHSARRVRRQPRKKKHSLHF